MILCDLKIAHEGVQLLSTYSTEVYSPKHVGIYYMFIIGLSAREQFSKILPFSKLLIEICVPLVLQYLLSQFHLGNIIRLSGETKTHWVVKRNSLLEKYKPTKSKNRCKNQNLEVFSVVCNANPQVAIQPYQFEMGKFALNLRRK